jgi:hypothetical protein
LATVESADRSRQADDRLDLRPDRAVRAQPDDGAGAARRRDAVGCRGDAGRVEVGHEHRCPISDEALGDRQPDPSRRTGDDRSLSVEPSHR